MASRSRWKNIPAPLETGTSTPHLFTEKPQPKKHLLIGLDFKDMALNRRYVVSDLMPKKDPGDPNEALRFIVRSTSARLGDTSGDLVMTISELEEKLGRKFAESAVSESPITGRSHCL